METKIIKLDPADPNMTQVMHAAEVIDAGGLVAFPTETVYGLACRVKNDSLARLDKIKSRNSEKYYTLHIAKKNDVKKYVPSIGPRTQKLITNAWPGPLTIVFQLTDEEIATQKACLDKEVFESLYHDDSIGIRCPNNLIASKLLQSVQNPVVAPSANITGEPPPTNAQQVIESFSGKIELILDGGPCKHKKNSTVVKIGKDGLQILRTGVFPKSELERLSKINFLFVCTGNTCRSPMAEGIFAKYLAEKLQCKVDQLEEKGYKMDSAGTMGIIGVPASAEAVKACAAKGINIEGHLSRALSLQLIEESDFILAMSSNHCRMIKGLCPQVADKCGLLADKDIVDPIGQPQRVYNSCADTIEEAIQRKISEIII